MKNTKKTAAGDFSTPYRTNKAGFIKAPANPTNGDPKSGRIVGNKDLRGGRS